jgi:hypothetical protein
MRVGLAVTDRSTARVISCQKCGFLALRVATVMEAAQVTIEHLTAAGCPADQILIHPLEVTR